MHTLPPFGSYLVLQKLAQTPLSAVYLAKSSDPWHLGRVLALKRMRSDLLADPSFVALYVQAVRQAMRLSHDNIVRTFELNRLGRDYYTAMEYVSGRSLDVVLRRAAQVNLRFNEQVMLLLGVQVCDALAYAHSAPTPMVHRDVCPSNILLSFTGKAKVVNFGVAQAASLAARARVAFFRDHFAYLAPEQLRGQALDGRADQFSLAAVLYEVVTGERLLGGRTDNTVIARLRAGALPAPRARAPDLSPETEAVLQRALSLSPAGRFVGAAAMGAALQEILERRYRGGDPHMLAQLMSDLFPRTVQREAALWKKLVRSGWVPPQATAVVRWLGAGLPELGTPMLATPRARQEPHSALRSDGMVLLLAAALACSMVALSVVLTR